MKNYDVLFFILLTLFSSLGLRLPQDNDTITALQTQVEKQSLELFQLRQDLYKKSSIDWMTQKDVKAFCKREGYLPMTHILLKKNIKDETIDLNLLHTLVNMPFHKMLIATSLKRTCRKGSKHYHGKAIDLRWDRNSKNLVEWLCTKEGRNWREMYGVNFYVENVKDEKFKKSRYHYFFNKNATGQHVHIEIK